MVSRDRMFCAYGDECKNRFCTRRLKNYTYPEEEQVSMANFDDCEFKPEEYKPKEEKE